MKNLFIVLTFVAVLAMSGTTFAEFIFEVTPLADPAPSLEAYLVTTTGIGGFKNLTVTNVHQVWWDGYGTEMTTPFGTIPEGMPNAAIGKATDSHFIFKSGGEVLNPIVAIGVFGETKTADSPISAALPHPLLPGMGSLGIEGCEFAFGWDVYDVNTPLELMKVVIPAGTTCYLSGIAGYAGRSSEFLVSIPEPSTIMMLIAGSFCLLGVRIRK